MNKLRAAVVGVGHMGQYHLSAQRTMSEFETVAVCDVVPEHVIRFADEYEIAGRYTDVRAMLEEARPDLVAVATQARQHHEVVMACAEAGVKGILCEKPMALDLRECDEMVELCARKGVKIAVNHQAHTSPSTRMAQEMVATGEIGDVLLVRGLNKGSRLAGCELMEMGTHTADRMICFGGMAKWCQGFIEVDGRPADARDIIPTKALDPQERDAGLVMGHHAFAHYGFTNALLGEQYFMAWAPAREFGVDVVGTRGTLRLAGQRLEVPLYHLPYPTIRCGGGEGDWIRIDPPEYPHWDALDASICLMYQELVHSIETGADHASSGEVGRHALEMVMAIYESHWRKARVELPLQDRRHPLERWLEETGLPTPTLS